MGPLEEEVATIIERGAEGTEGIWALTEGPQNVTTDDMIGVLMSMIRANGEAIKRIAREIDES